MNFVEKLIEAGFEETLIKDFNPKNNWFGVSKTNPDAVLTMGEKEVIISLQGTLGMLYLTATEELANKQIFEARAGKLIILKNGRNVVYKTFTGIIPHDDFIEDFIKQ